MDWLIIYADGSEFSSDDGEPWDAPRSGVQMVFRADPDTGVTAEPNAYGYWAWIGNGWRAVDMMGFYDHLMHHPRPLVIFGRSLPDEEWKGWVRRRIEETTGLKKSAWHSREYAL